MAVTPVFVCGAECNIAGLGTASAGVEHWATIGTTAPTISTTTFNSAGGGVRSLRFNSSAQQVSLGHTFTTAIASPATMVARFYLYFASLPLADQAICTGSPTSEGVHFRSASGALWAGEPTGGGYAASGISVTTGVWYRIDLKVVRGATRTVDLQVDGVAAAQYSAVSSAGTITGVLLGQSGANATHDYFIDDVCISGTSANYPIGIGTVAGLYPTSDGTHGGGWATGVFGKGTSGATNASNTDTDIWSSLDNPLTTTAAGSWVSDLTGVATTNYVEFRNASLPGSPTTVNGAMLVVTTHSASATANNLDFAINDGSGHTATLISALDLSESTITVPIIVRNTDANGVAWTPTTLTANRNRFSSTDSNPDVYLDGFCWEVDYVASGGTTPITDSETETLTDTGVVAAALTATETETLTEAISGAVTTSSSESAALTEGVPSIGLANADTGTLGETPRTAANTATFDAGALTEVIAGAATLSNTDAAALTEAGSVQALVSLTGTDTGTLTDNGVVQALTAITDTDSAALTDTAAINAGLTNPDSGTLTETPGIAAALTATEAAALTEAAKTIGVALPDSDTGTLTDTASAAAVVINADTGALAESPGIAADLANADSAAVSEALKSLTAGVASTDTGTLSETEREADTLHDSDAGTLTDTGSVVATAAGATPITDSDSATLTESASLSVTMHEAPREPGIAYLPWMPGLFTFTLTSTRAQVRYRTRRKITVAVVVTATQLTLPGMTVDVIAKQETSPGRLELAPLAKTVTVAKRETVAKHATDASRAWVAHQNEIEEAFLIGRFG